METISDSKKKATHKVIINESFCKPAMCQICVGMCPRNSLAYDGHRINDLNRCIGCKLCEMYCPDMAIKIERKNDEKEIITRK